MSPADLARIRQLLRLSQAELAALLGAHPMTVSRWESGQLAPSPWQQALLGVFANAARRSPKVGREAALAARNGVPQGLFLLLAAGLAFTPCPACASRGCVTCDGYGFQPHGRPS